MTTATEKVNYLVPSSVEEALNMAKIWKGDFDWIAGGTDVMVNRQQGNHATGVLIDIRNLKELKQIREEEGILIIGAGVTLAQLIKDERVNRWFPLLATAAKHVATPVIRQSATIAGNIFCENRCSYYNHSDFWREAAGNCLKCGGNVCIVTGGNKRCFSVYVSDVAPALLALEAKLLVAGGKEEVIPLAEVFSGDGLSPHGLPKEHLVTGISVPVRQHPLPNSWFGKLRPRKSVDFTNLTMAICHDPITDEIFVGVSGTGMGPVLIRAERKAQAASAILKSLRKQSNMVDNLFYSRKYRLEMLEVFLSQGLAEVLEERGER